MKCYVIVYLCGKKLKYEENTGKLEKKQYNELQFVNRLSNLNIFK